MPLVAGVDSSTQSTKVEIRDADSGVLVASGRAPHPAVSPPRSEQDPAAWWLAFEAAWAAAGGPDRRVAAIAIAGQQHGMVVLDGAGEVIRPAKLWNDTESAPDAGWLIKQLDGGAAAWAAACGTVPVASLTITKLSWLHRTEPESWARLARVMLPHDWITLRLCGDRVTDRGDASGTGYWSPAKGEYRYDLLAVVDAARDWTDALPRVAGPLEAVGTWEGAVVAPGTGDNMAAALGAALRPGDVAISLGTSGTVATVAAAATADPGGAVCGFASADGAFLPLVCTLNATRVTDTIGTLLGLDHEQLDAAALAAPLGAGGLVVLPYFDGERTPNRPKATGVLGGLRTSTSPAEVARAAFEGVVCAQLDGLDHLSSVVGVLDGRLVLVGGGAHSPAYRRILADVAGRPVDVLRSDEQVAAGACVQAAAVLHQRAPGEVAAAWNLAAADVIEPSPSSDAVAELRAAYAARRDAEA
ncbi:MAG: xylulokinase [Acidimicrobiaceae bacterium]|nr:xylulokinase [Acidimicrobiaceae bacterium]